MTSIIELDLTDDLIIEVQLDSTIITGDSFLANLPDLLQIYNQAKSDSSKELNND
ncbi:TPA: hypothetical protein PXF07_000073 [Mannheimia haemolytica]|uniref:Uncharacterized protein n=1 Tax=Mannheimia haemolytica TaxID=75985 RepID=A0A378MSX7_MANHA|nr:hypothetical protein [Mannheimia haemolytica]AGQ26442.1 hypothetical protein F382_11040 [Mannheimia haemolytica D153]AGQ41985.1 hypothetical protein J451_11150 [Mannheimia haemolytica D174]AGQ42300.1 hypothetical protein J451_12780 [Mannheimia haemolytica D174]AGR74380.1 hypothetical protein N220_03145 [Mannheimia haemolytica USMARC_2286]EDN74868.1 hypothetical protein MHA_1969 [Mannheimia haemolytica PHL213]